MKTTTATKTRRGSYSGRRGLEEKGAKDDRAVSMKAGVSVDVGADDEMAKNKASLFKADEDLKVKMAASDGALEKDSGKRGLEEKGAKMSMKAKSELLFSFAASNDKEEDASALKNPKTTTGLSAANLTVEGDTESLEVSGVEPSTNRPGGRNSNRSAPQPGAHAVPGDQSTALDIETGTVVVGGTVVGGTVHADPVVDDGLEEEIREEVQAEMQRKLETQIATAEAVDPSEAMLKEKSPIFTRRRVLATIGIGSLAIIGLVLGLLFPREQQEPADPNTIQSTRGAGGRFADFIVLSRDGSTLAAGSDKESYARIFRRIDNGTEWTQIGETLEGEGQFGRAMDFNRNGSMLIVGSWSNEEVAEKAGKAQVFGYNGTGWDPVGQELFGDASEDRFGYFVSMSDDGGRIAVSARNADPSLDRVDAGIVRLYELNATGYWSQLGPDLEGDFEDEQFGKRIAMNANGTRLAVSTVRWNEKRGRIQVFDYEEGGWSRVGQTLEGTEIDGWLGTALSMTPDGTFMAIGSDGADADGEDSGFVVVYKLEGDTWKMRGNAIAGPGEQVRLGIRNVPMSDDGHCLAAGGSHFQNETGIGFLFQWKNETWEKVSHVIGGSPGDRFGGSSALSGDCKWVAWGANQKEYVEEGAGYLKVFAVDELIDEM